MPGTLELIVSTSRYEAVCTIDSRFFLQPLCLLDDSLR